MLLHRFGLNSKEPNAYIKLKLIIEYLEVNLTKKPLKIS